MIGSHCISFLPVQVVDHVSARQWIGMHETGQATTLSKIIVGFLRVDVNKGDVIDLAGNFNQARNSCRAARRGKWIPEHGCPWNLNISPPTSLDILRCAWMLFKTSARRKGTACCSNGRHHPAKTASCIREQTSSGRPLASSRTRDRASWSHLSMQTPQPMQFS